MISPSNTYAITQTNRIFKRATNKNMPAKQINRELLIAHLAGVNSGLFEIIEKYKEDPVKDAELLIGDIVESFVASSNQICKILEKPANERVDIEDILKHLGIGDRDV